MKYRDCQMQVSSDGQKWIVQMEHSQIYTGLTEMKMAQYCL